MEKSLIKIKFFRFTAFLIAFTALLLLLLLSFILLVNIAGQYPTISSVFQQPQVFIPLILIILFVIFFNIKNIDAVSIPYDNPKDISSLQDTANTLSRNCEINPPHIQILDHLTPTSFAYHKGFKNYEIYITRPLLENSNKIEIDSVIAHEISHIYSGFTAAFKLMLNLIFILKFIGILDFLLFLGILRIEFPLVWLTISVPLFLFLFNKQINTDFFFSSILMKITFPVLLLIDPFSQFLIFLISHKEENYADAKAVSLLNSKAGLFSILQKLKDYKGFTADLPQKFYPLYFTRELTIIKKCLITQPVVSERVLNITKFKEAY